jgi:hypothetical protein
MAATHLGVCPALAAPGRPSRFAVCPRLRKPGVRRLTAAEAPAAAPPLPPPPPSQPQLPGGPQPVRGAKQLNRKNLAIRHLLFAAVGGIFVAFPLPVCFGFLALAILVWLLPL